MRVDFHAETLRLFFSRGAEESEGHPTETANVCRDRLLNQARPAQVRILEQYGEARHGEAHLVPQCVCGSNLVHVSYEERLRRCLILRIPGIQNDNPQFEDTVASLLASNKPCFHCDLCGEYRRSGSVWTCENDNNTILHTNAYDVCEECFARYVYSKSGR